MATSWAGVSVSAFETPLRTPSRAAVRMTTGIAFLPRPSRLPRAVTVATNTSGHCVDSIIPTNWSYVSSSTDFAGPAFDSTAHWAQQPASLVQVASFEEAACFGQAPSQQPVSAG